VKVGGRGDKTVLTSSKQMFWKGGSGLLSGRKKAQTGFEHGTVGRERRGQRDRIRQIVQLVRKRLGLGKADRKGLRKEKPQARSSVWCGKHAARTGLKAGFAESAVRWVRLLKTESLGRYQNGRSASIEEEKKRNRRVSSAGRGRPASSKEQA